MIAFNKNIRDLYNKSSFSAINMKINEVSFKENLYFHMYKKLKQMFNYNCKL